MAFVADIKNEIITTVVVKNFKLCSIIIHALNVIYIYASVGKHRDIIIYVYIPQLDLFSNISS